MDNQPVRRNLAAYDNSHYSPGRGRITRTIWYFVSVAVFENGWFPLSGLKVRLLRIFGAKVGNGVMLKPHVRVKYPWRLRIGNHCWIGQEVWIDNLDDVDIEDNVCLSQGVYICTGSHDHRSPTFELKTKPVHVGAGAWVACRAIILQGVDISPGEVVSAGVVYK